MYSAKISKDVAWINLVLAKSESVCMVTALFYMTCAARTAFGSKIAWAGEGKLYLIKFTYTKISLNEGYK